MIVVCGGGIAGLAAALILSRRGHDITVIEPDDAPLPDDPESAWLAWKRRGVAQLRQFHGFTTLGRNVLAEELPDVLEDLRAAGVSERDVDAELSSAFGLEPAKFGPLPMLHPRRTTFELVLRKRAVASPSITWRSGERVTGVVTRDGRVTGAVTDERSVDTELVVDATGRLPRSTAWLADAGCGPGVDDWSETGIVYFTRWYRLLGDAPRGTASPRVELGSTRAVIAPADREHFTLAFMAAADDPALRALREVPAFQRVASNVPGIGPWVDPDVATPASDVMFMGGLRNQYRRLLDQHGAPVRGIVAIGDAAVCTNPYFARGMALALRHAQLLADAVAATDTEDLAEAFDDVTCRELRPWFEDAVDYDTLRTTWLRRERGEQLPPEAASAVDSERGRLLRLVPMVGPRDPEVLRRYVAYLQGMVQPSELWSDEVAARVLPLEEQLQPVLSRAELLELLG